MRKLIVMLIMGLVLGEANGDDKQPPKPNADGFYTLFNGKDLEGWKVGDNAKSFSVKDGMLVANGNVAHLFYDGPVKDHNFKNFHFKAEVMTFPKANSGIYFHTQYQEKSWPAKGFEAQVNNSHTDWKRTGGLYNVADVKEAPAKDEEWFLYEIIVKDRQITVKINGKTVTDFTVKDDYQAPQGNPGRVLLSGTFAIQAHDPGSKVYYRNIVVKPLED
jgi:hypothetical protein